MLTFRLSLLAAGCLCGALAMSAAALPLAFEQRDGFFIARSTNGSALFQPGRVTVGGLTLHFLPASPGVRLEGLGPAAPATYLGAGESRTFSQFPRLAMRNLYPGMDAVFYGNAGRLEYDLQLAPGTSLARMSVAFENAARLRLDADGSLVAETASGTLRQLPPRVIQGRRQVPARYVLLGANRVSIHVGKYDSRLPLTIDPVLVYAKYFGGSGFDTANAVATDPQGNVYVAGSSNSLDFPAVDGASSRPLPPLVALTNTGQTVTPLPIAGENSVTAIGGTPDGSILYAAAAGGIYYSSNGGASWRATGPIPAVIFSVIQAPLVVNDISVDAIDPSRAYAASNRGMFSTGDNGGHWNPVDYDLAATQDGSIQAASVTVSQVDHTLLYATTGRPNFLYKSINAAGTWQILYPAYPGEPPAGYYPSSLIVFTLLPGSTDLYVVDANSIYLKSADGGDTWQRGAGGLFGSRAIRVDPANPSNIFVLDNFGVQKSVDGGQTFATVTPAGVRGSDVTAFTYDGASHALYVATTVTVYASADQGTTWQTAPMSPANVHVLQPFGGRVFIGLDTPPTTFLVKFDPTGSRLLYSTFFTGRPLENVVALRVDGQGSAYLTGNTNSQNFGGATQLSAPSPPSIPTSYVAKVAPDGTSLSWLAVLGAARGVYTQGLAIDRAGAAYITGFTASADFPTTPSAFQSALPTAPCPRPNDTSFIFHDPNTQTWAFVSKVLPDGSGLAYSTFLTGTCGSSGLGIAVNAAGEAFVTGVTTSPGMPVSPNAYQGAFPGPLDKTGFPNAFTAGFIARLSAAGDRVLSGTYVGGGFNSSVTAVALDPSGNPVFTGSTWGIAPGPTPGAYQTVVKYNCSETSFFGPPHPPSNGTDVFVLKLDPALSKAAYLTYLGGSCYDSGTALALDPAGDAWVTGVTGSGDFPLDSPFQGTSSSAFVTELSPDGSRLLFSSRSDGAALAIDPGGQVYVAGSSSFSTVPKRSQFSPIAFLGKIGPGTNPQVQVNSIFNVSLSDNSNNNAQPPFPAFGVAPGELVRIEGHNLGPATKVDAQLDSTGRLPFTVASTRVWFDALPAPLISVQDGVIVCFVPFAASQAAQLTVESGGQRSNSLRVAVVPSLPEVLAVANQDGSANSISNPAAVGSVIAVYVTGLGQTNPASVDGQVNTSTAAVPIVPLTVSIGGVPVVPQFVGAARGMVAGITQLNLLVPAPLQPTPSGQSFVSVNSAGAALSLKP